MMIEKEMIAIVGLGGTGSHVLDHISKTEVRAIDLFDGDRMLDRNIPRAPGAVGQKDICVGEKKAWFYKRIYSAVHANIGANECITTANVGRLADYDTVFACMDQGPDKRLVIETCLDHGVLLIDSGMGVPKENGRLRCVLRVTTPRSMEDAGVIATTAPRSDAHGAYANNQQIELNAMNAALAVIRWKKERGLYVDDAPETTTTCFHLAENRISSR